MVSAPSAAGMLTRGASLPALPLTSAARSAMPPELSAPKQNTRAMSSWGGSSFESFDNAFDAALREATGQQLPRKDVTGEGNHEPATESDPTADQQQPFASSKATFDGSQQAFLPRDASVNPTIQKQAPSIDQQPASRTNESKANDHLPDPKPTKAAAVKPESSAEFTPRPDKSAEAPQVGSNLGPPSMISDVAGNAPQPESPAPGSGLAVRLSDSSATRVPAQVDSAPAQPITAKFDRETEAFRIDLHADTAVSIEGAGQSATSMTAPSGLGEQNETKDVAACQDNGVQQNQERARSSALKTTASAQTSGKSLNSGTPEENKQIDKATLKNPDPEAGKVFLAPTASVSPGGTVGNSARAAEATKAQAEIAAAQTDKLPPSAAPGEVRELVVRLQGNSGASVSVRMVDQGGQVQVAVRSSDSAAVAQLRQDLTSLTSNLDRAGWRAEAAPPPGAHAATHEPRPSDSEAQGGDKNAKFDWDERESKKRPALSEVWDSVLESESA